MSGDSIRCYRDDHALWREVIAERERQNAQWGEQNHPNGTGVNDHDKIIEKAVREECERAFREGQGSWRHILNEEVAEANAEPNPAKLRAELIQVIAVATAWVEAIDRRALS